MKKKLIALAVAGIASSSVMAQSNVTIYGNIDLAIVQNSGTSSGIAGSATAAVPAVTGVGVDVNAAGTTATGRGAQTAMMSGMRAASRIGFKGTENLGGGLKASFVVETQPDASGGAGQAAPSVATHGVFGGREATLGLEGSFGSIAFGRMGVGADYASFDAAGAVTSGSIDFLMYDASANRLNNTIQYVTPEFAGFKGTYQLSMSENQGSVAQTAASVQGTQTSLELAYAAGPVVAKIGQTITRDILGTVGVPNFGTKFVLNNVGLAYDFGVARLSGQYVTQRASAAQGAGNNQIDANTWQIGVKVPVGAHAFSANYVNTNDKRVQNQDASSWYLGYDYAMSKRTTAYVGATAVNNRNGATFSALSNTGLGGTNAAARTNALYTGMNHSF